MEDRPRKLAGEPEAVLASKTFEVGRVNPEGDAAIILVTVQTPTVVTDHGIPPAGPFVRHRGPIPARQLTGEIGYQACRGPWAVALCDYPDAVTDEQSEVEIERRRDANLP